MKLLKFYLENLVMIPCKDCIVFPICKSISLKKSLLTKSTYVQINGLFHKCSLFRNWISNIGFREVETDVKEIFGYPVIPR